MIVFIVNFIIFIVLIFLLAKLRIYNEFDWKINVSIAAIGAIFLGFVTISQANYPAEYSQQKTETHNLMEVLFGGKDQKVGKKMITSAKIDLVQ